jgi:hypothetical protein
VTRFLVAEEGGCLAAHQPTKNQAMHPSLFTHPLDARQQGGSRHRRQAATMPSHGGNEDTSGISNVGGGQQSTINNQLKAAAATVTETAKTAMRMNENKGNGGGGRSAMAGRWRWRWQRGFGVGSSTAATRRWQGCQLGNGGGSLVAAAARGQRQW